MKRDVYFGFVKLFGEEDGETLVAANNYASTLAELRLFEEAKALCRKLVPVARRVAGESTVNTLRMRTNYARALYRDPGATLADLREAVTILEEIDRTARRVYGNTNPLTIQIKLHLENARADLSAHETPSGSSQVAQT